MNKVVYSHQKDDWETPQSLFYELNLEFNFDVDLAANKKNSKCICYIGDISSVLYNNPSNLRFDSAFCNPPYSSQRKFIEFSLKHNLPTVFLLPSRTDTKMFHELIYNKPGFEIRFIKGRLKFSESKNSAPFPSMLVIFRGVNP